MPDFGDINWIAVLVSIVAAQVLGFLWYGPLFGKQWMAALGKTQEEIRAEGPGPAIVVGIIHSVLNAVGVALIVNMLDTPDLISGIKVGLLTSIAFAGITVLTQAAYENRPPVTTWLYFGFLVVTITVMGAIIGGWT